MCRGFLVEIQSASYVLTYSIISYGDLGASAYIEARAGSTVSSLLLLGALPVKNILANRTEYRIGTAELSNNN